MDEALKRLDEAYSLGEQELQHLLGEDLDQMAETAEQRNRLVKEALRVSTVELTEDNEAEFLEKVRRLERQHGMLFTEARKLHKRLREDLAKLKKENKRITAYHGAHRPTPLIRYHYLNKQS